jgi:hypothetical protein
MRIMLGNHVQNASPELRLSEEYSRRSSRLSTLPLGFRGKLSRQTTPLTRCCLPLNQCPGELPLPPAATLNRVRTRSPFTPGAGALRVTPPIEASSAPPAGFITT